MPIVLGRKINIGRPQNRPELISGKRYYVKTTEIFEGVNVILSGIYLRDNAYDRTKHGAPKKENLMYFVFYCVDSKVQSFMVRMCIDVLSRYVVDKYLHY
jgi:hypothetical protein